MSTVIKDLGVVTAYAYAVAGGYQGTEADFQALLGNVATDLNTIENLTASASTLSEGSSATATYSNGNIAFGIPKGDTGATGADGKDGKDGQDGAPGANPDAFTVTLAAANWSSNALTVSDARFLASGYAYMVNAAPSDTYDWQDANIYADNVTTNGQMTFHCETVPSGDLTANIIRLELAV